MPPRSTERVMPSMSRCGPGTVWGAGHRATHNVRVGAHDDHVDELRRVRGDDQAGRVEELNLLLGGVGGRHDGHVDVAHAEPAHERLDRRVVEHAAPKKEIEQGGRMRAGG